MQFSSSARLLVSEFEHQWEPKPTAPNSLFQERFCPVCELRDRRVVKRKSGDTVHGWQVFTPCIEPVPESVEYQDLILELIEHGVHLRPWCIGAPGEWTVGFVVDRDRKPYPAIKLKTHENLEHGYARLTRWIRARTYRADLYSGIAFSKKRI